MSNSALKKVLKKEVCAFFPGDGSMLGAGPPEFFKSPLIFCPQMLHIYSFS